MTDQGNSVGRRLRVLAIHRYFWPDTPPYASLLRAISARWARDGHEVHVLSSQPSYKPGTDLERQPEKHSLDGFQVHRVDLPMEHGRHPFRKLTNLVRFALAIVKHARRNGPYDVILASTAPPILLGAAAAFAARRCGARFIYHCMDIHPEIGRISGEFRNPVLFSLLQRLDSMTCSTANPVVVLSDDMAKALASRPAAAPKSVSVINNFALPAYESAADIALPEWIGSSSNRLRVLFAGNLGRFQGLDVAVEAMHKLVDRDDVELILMGEGRALADLRTQAGDLAGDLVRFIPHQSASVAKRVMRVCDAGLVTLTPGIHRYAYPSKTMTYLEEGLPLVAAVERGSALASFVETWQVGASVDPGNSAAMAKLFEDWAENRNKLFSMSDRARQVAAEFFGEDVVLDRWSELLKQPESVI